MGNHRQKHCLGFLCYEAPASLHCREQLWERFQAPSGEPGFGLPSQVSQGEGRRGSRHYKGSVEAAMGDGLLLLSGREQLPLLFPGGQENLPGQHPEWGNCPKSSLASVHTCEGPLFSHSPSFPSPTAQASSPMTTKPSAAVDGHLAPAVDTSLDLPLSPVPPPLSLCRSWRGLWAIGWGFPHTAPAKAKETEEGQEMAAPPRRCLRLLAGAAGAVSTSCQ